MVLEFFKGGADRQLEGIERRIVVMLQDCRHAFDLSMTALLAGGDPTTVGPEVRTTDIRVNKAERAVRRELVVHVSVRGAKADLPMVLATMSIVKDVERIGDYAKNVWDLTAEGIDFSSAPDRDDLVAWRSRTSSAIGDVARVFQDRDTAAAHEMIKAFDEILDECDERITSQLTSPESPREAVPRALLFRYLKRIYAHLMNVLSSLVMPLDRLDYYDEDKADRV
ncbi:MAG TPA: PhoU domain-containing protein [Acidimicrobiia bacterium]|nr:PhoU domain-containing protein [Acidimicrobiia bacterium]